MRGRGEVYMGNLAAERLAETQAIRRRVAELETQGKLEEFTREKDLADRMKDLNSQHDVKAVLRDAERHQTVRQALHELEIKKRLRAMELEDLDEEHRKELEKIQVQHQHEVAAAILIAQNQRVTTQAEFDREQHRLANTHALEEQWRINEHRRQDERADAVERYGRLIDEAKANLEAARLRTDQRVKELDVKRAEIDLAHYEEQEKQRLRTEYERHQADLLRQIQQQEQDNLQTMTRFKLEEKRLELDLSRFEKEKDSEVALATIDGNVRISTSQQAMDAAVAAERARQLEARLADRDAQVGALREDANRRAGDLKEMAGILASGQPKAAAPAPGQPTGVTGPAADGESPCPQCRRPVPHRYNVCPWCGHKIVAT
jgi:hypothetical protein